MKLSTAYTFQYILLMGFTLLLTPAKQMRPVKVDEVKIEKTEQQPIARENTEEILHGALLLRF